MADAHKLPDDNDDPTALWRAHREAAALLRDLEAVETIGRDLGAVETIGGNELTAARRYIAILTAHLGPLRRVVDDVEFAAKAEKIVAGLSGGTVPL